VEEHAAKYLQRLYNTICWARSMNLVVAPFR
jgi:hypothetical protein